MNASALSCVKISVLLFYRRLSVTFSRGFMIATWIGIVYNILYCVGFMLVLTLTCRPVNAYWDKVNPIWANEHDWRCGSEQIALPAAGALSVLGDFYSALLPMLLIVGLDLPKRQKLGLYMLFAIAFLVVGAGIARTILVNIVINRSYDVSQCLSSSVFNAHLFQFTWVLWEVWIWVQVELYLALLAASAPALKPFLRRFLVEPMTSSGGRKTPGYGNQYGDRMEMKNAYAFDKDVETDTSGIGVAYGSPDLRKSREDSFEREVDDAEQETRHFELRQSRDGKKMIPMQVRKKKRGSFSTSENVSWPVPPIDATHKQYEQHQRQRQGHVRNFSQPHSYNSSGDTAVGSMSRRAHIASQMSTPEPDPYSLGQAHVIRRLSQGSGSVKMARLRAQQQVHSRDSSNASPAPRTNSQTGDYSTANPQQRSQAQYLSHQRSTSAQRDRLRQPAPLRVNRGRESRLDSSSEYDTDDDQMGLRHQRRTQNDYEPPWINQRGEMNNQMYVVNKPPWQNTSTLLSPSRGPSQDHRRSSSEETLALPRMGSNDDFRTERRDSERLEKMREREAALNAARARVAMREMEDEMERDKVRLMREREDKARWRREGSQRR